MNSEPFNETLRVYVNPVLEWKRETGIVLTERELTLVNKVEGFAGTADVFFRYGQNGIGILDYKTRKTKPGEELQAYDGQAMQLAAYAATYWGEEALDRVLAANVYISTTEPGRMAVVKHADLRKHWEAFKISASLWRYLKDFDPRIVK
jgi:RecB family exonuclease